MSNAHPRRLRLGREGVLVALVCVVALSALRTGAYFVPGDPKKGMKVFFDKGCARCHSVLGEGARRAPDLARTPAGHLNVTQLVAAMWNHAPQMWEKMQLEGFLPPRFDTQEMTDLFAFLYSMRSFDEPGSPERGRRLMTEKQCVVCHAIEGRGGQVGPDLRTWAKYRNPVTWTQTMWNHAPQMQRAMALRNLRWPTFAGTDMADLMAYVRTESPAGPGAYVGLPEATRGRQLFASKGCVRCHGTRAPEDPRAPRGQGFPQTLGQFAGRMWNHSPQMWSSMQGAKIPWPQFTQSEMADLIAYLFSERYLQAHGNSRIGEQIFQAKRCAACHATGPATFPEEGRGAAGLSSIQLATSMWNHGPAMLATMRESKVSWPRFEEQEIAHLLAFLRSRKPPTEKR